MGAGKSVVGAVLRSLGIPVFDADAAAKALYHTDAGLRHAVAAFFGREVLTSEEELDRAALARHVFGDARALQALNALVHPAVRACFQQWRDRQHLLGHDVVVREAAVLFESGSAVDCDRIWVVDAPLELRKRRVKVRNGWSDAAIEERLRHQWPAERLRSMAHDVILNDGQEPLVPRIVSLCAEL